MLKKTTEKVLDYFLRFQSFQDYINFRYNRKGYQVIDEQFLEGLYYHYNGFVFYLNNQLGTINEVINDYEFSDIRETDIVLDIGANIGAFSMFSSKKAKQVFAVEPLYSDVLIKNLEINNIKNVTVLEIGIGYGELNLTYGVRNKTVKCYSLSEIIQLCGGHIDFLKIDCEGGEWCIQPHELKGIRRIDAEIHNFDKKHDLKKFERILDYAGFNYKTKRLSDELMLIHAQTRLSPNRN